MAISYKHGNETSGSIKDSVFGIAFGMTSDFSNAINMSKYLFPWAMI
jgi:hypothetical protein